MSHSRKGILWKFAGVVAGMAGLIPAAVLLNPWRNAKKAGKLDEIYFGHHLMKALAIAIAVAGVIVGSRPPSSPFVDFHPLAELLPIIH